jgi:membrane protein DedA with SNARE-associated domain
VASVIAGTHHEINIVAVIVTAALASIVGRSIGYLIGRYFGYWLLLRYGSYIWVNEARIKLGQYLFLRHGGKIIIVAQFVPVLRTIAGVMAGANRMPGPQFLLANVVGAFAWAIFFGTAAYTLGRQVERLAGWGVVVLVITTVIVLVIAAHFVRGHEAQLAAKAERALPGPLQSP